MLMIINRLESTPNHLQFTSSQNSIDQYLWSSSNVGATSSANQPNQLLMKYWNSPKQSANSGNSSNNNKAPIPTIIRNAKIVGGQGIGGGVVTYNHNNCDEIANETKELDVKIQEMHSPHRDFQTINNSSNNANMVTIGHSSAPKDFGCDDTYEDGIDKDMRDLERRLESELEEHEKLWSPDEETPISQT